jgi:peptide methionine sulfoxide reductase MsrA
MKRKIVLGGGCFWGLQELLRQRSGIIQTTVGYARGDLSENCSEVLTGKYVNEN